MGAAGGLLRGTGWVDGAGPMGLSFNAPPGEGVAEKGAGRAGRGRLIYRTRSLAPLKASESELLYWCFGTVG